MPVFVGSRLYNGPMPEQSIRSTTEAFAEFTAILGRDGLRPALARMLEQSSFRFIGAWRFDGDMSAPAVHYDRENPEVLDVAPVPASATYCSFIRAQEQPFSTAYAVLDARLLGHPARDTVASYTGVPLLDAQGAVIGTLCHYDLVPRDVAGVDQQLALLAAGYIMAGGFLPPYPTAPAAGGA